MKETTNKHTNGITKTHISTHHSYSTNSLL